MDKEKLSLVIRKCSLEDSGMYSCEIQQFVKDGEKEQINCNVTIEGCY